MRCFSLKLAFLFERRTFANLGNICCVLHDFVKVISSNVFAYLVLRFSNDLTILNMPFLCFFLICLNELKIRPKKNMNKI